MSSSWIVPPQPDEVELSFFGPTFGEAIAVHYGGGRWLLVDSCLDPQSVQPASLAYLQALAIPVETAVELIVVTHWHDDHVRGIADLFRACSSASIAISSVLSDGQFLKLVGHYAPPSLMESSGIDEFVALFQILEQRRPAGVRFNPPIFAAANKRLLSAQIQVGDHLAPVAVHALSPSDASHLQAILAFSRLLPESPLRLASPAPNHASVALWMEVGEHRVLLGADLERTSDPMTGWSAVLAQHNPARGKGSAFKIPHHGSKTGHHAQVWSEMLTAEPHAVVTPFYLGKNRLPLPEDIKRIRALTPNAFATARPRRRRYRSTTSLVRRQVARVSRNVEVIDNWGHVRLRRTIEGEKDNWRVELFGSAYALQ